MVNEIEKDMKALISEAKKAEKPVSESADDIKLAIYESCHAGEIDEEQCDELLGILE